MSARRNPRPLPRPSATALLAAESPAVRDATRLLALGDPRDDMPEDSAAWVAFLGLLAARRNREHDLFFILWSFRVQGMRLVRESGAWRLRPTYGLAGWDDEATYARNREEWLVPFGDDVRGALRELEERL